MKEYIVEFGDALYNEETGEAVFNPKIKGELIRCKDCKYKEAEEIGMVYCSIPIDGWVSEDWFCADGERKENG